MTRLRLRAFVTSASLALSTLAVVHITDTAATAASSNVITTTSPGKPIKNETFIVRGQLVTQLQRPIQLQRHTSKGWKTVKSGTTTDTGKFAVPTSTTGKKTYRVYAPKVTIGSKTYAYRVTTKRVVTPTPQTVRTTVDRTTLSGGNTAHTLTIANTPIRKGRLIGIRLGFVPADGGDPVRVDLRAAVQNVNGKWRATNPLGSEVPKGTLTYQGYAVEANGAARKYGNTVKITVK